MILLYGLQKMSWLVSWEVLILIAAVFLLAYIRANDLARWIRWFAIGIIVFMVGLILCTLLTCCIYQGKSGCGYEKGYSCCLSYGGAESWEKGGCYHGKAKSGCSKSWGGAEKACCKKSKGKSCKKWGGEGHWGDYDGEWGDYHDDDEDEDNVEEGDDDDDEGEDNTEDSDE